ncbi:MAG: STAS domain-containing protein [Planctomycetes bacterium]|nr:STAS domain-containing protein [Planctomycetota bacterium]
MGIQNWSESVILVNLAAEPYMGEELETVVAMVTEHPEKNVVIDFTDVQIVTSSSIAKLLKLRKSLFDNDRRLILSSVQPKTKSIFNLTGLDCVFEFLDNQVVALASIQVSCN